MKKKSSFTQNETLYKATLQACISLELFGLLGQHRQTEAGAVCCLSFMGPVIYWAGCCSQVAETCWRMPNTSRLCAYIAMPDHLGHVKLLCVGGPAAGSREPWDKKDLPCLCLCSVLSGLFAQGQCWVKVAEQESQSGSTEAVAKLSAMGAGRMHNWGAMGNGQCHCEATAVVLEGFWLSGEVAHHWKRATMFKKEKEGETRELSADPWEDQRANSPFFKGERFWEQPVWIC